MTTLEPTPYDRASYVGAIVDANLSEPGGLLYRLVSDLLTEANVVAMRAAGIAPDAPQADLDNWPTDDERVVGQIAGDIVEAMHQTARRYFESKSEPVPA